MYVRTYLLYLWIYMPPCMYVRTYLPTYCTYLCTYIHTYIHTQAHLLEERHLGVLLSTMSLLIALASKSPVDYEICVPYVIALLSRLVLTPRSTMDDYLYYNTPSPWLQVGS